MLNSVSLPVCTMELVNTHTHTHTHIYIYIYACVYEYVWAYCLNGHEIVLEFSPIPSETGSVSSTENDINMRLATAWTAIDRLLIRRKSNLSDEIKRNFFQVAVASILRYGRWSRGREKARRELHKNSRRAILNKSWKQHPKKQQVYGYLLPISKKFCIRQTWHAGHCWKSKDKLISDVLWTPSHRQSSVGRSKTCLQQLCTDTWCSVED